MDNAKTKTMSNTNPVKNRGWTQVLARDKQVVFHAHLQPYPFQLIYLFVIRMLVFTAYLNKAYVFTSGFDMIQNASGIRVNGGGDCPELAAAGILRGK